MGYLIRDTNLYDILKAEFKVNIKMLSGRVRYSDMCCLNWIGIF